MPNGTEKECWGCSFCGMDMDMDPYCVHPEVLKHNEWGSSVNVVRGTGITDDRKSLPHFSLCGPEARLHVKRSPR